MRFRGYEVYKYAAPRSEDSRMIDSCYAADCLMAIKHIMVKYGFEHGTFEALDLRTGKECGKYTVKMTRNKSGYHFVVHGSDSLPDSTDMMTDPIRPYKVQLYDDRIQQWNTVGGPVIVAAEPDDAVIEAMKAIEVYKGTFRVQNLLEQDNRERDLPFYAEFWNPGLYVCKASK